jgi:hypothetical protein
MLMFLSPLLTTLQHTRIFVFLQLGQLFLPDITHDDDGFPQSTLISFGKMLFDFRVSREEGSKKRPL